MKTGTLERKGSIKGFCIMLITIAAAMIQIELDAGEKTIDYRDYQLKENRRIVENTEWSYHWSFNARDKETPRILLIGDSICNGYQQKVREGLKKKANITYWISSKCVTDPFYLRELDWVLDYLPYSMITFNNGLHSLSTNQKEWKEAYDGVIRFIMTKCPKAKLTIVSSTPLKDPKRTKISKELSEISKEIAGKYKVGYLDLFTPLDKLDRKTYWADTFHLKVEGRTILAGIITSHIVSALNLSDKEKLKQLGSETGPDGAVK